MKQRERAEDRGSLQAQTVPDGPTKTVNDIEFATMEWVDWFNTRRHSTLGYITPDEFEAIYYAQPSILQPELSPA